MAATNGVPVVPCFITMRDTDKLDENSTAKRDGRAMQLGKGLDIDAAQAEKKADQKFRRQLTFSVLAVICLAAAIVCGALMQR